MAQASTVWPHGGFTPYDVLGVSSDASVGEVRRQFRRMALKTHPDKLPPEANRSGCISSSGRIYTFLEVRAAAEVLLDPQVRAIYDQERSQAMIRGCGACSDTYTLSEDFEEVGLADMEGDGEDTNGLAENLDTRVRVFVRECRCGGIYEVVLFTGPDGGGLPRPEGRDTVTCECDSCSLIVEVVVDLD